MIMEVIMSAIAALGRLHLRLRGCRTREDARALLLRGYRIVKLATMPTAPQFRIQWRTVIGWEYCDNACSWSQEQARDAILNHIEEVLDDLGWCVEVVEEF